MDWLISVFKFLLDVSEDDDIITGYINTINSYTQGNKKEILHSTITIMVRSIILYATCEGSDILMG